MTKNIITKNFLIRVLDKSGQGVHIVDPKGTTLYYNKTAEEIDGIAIDKMMGTNMNDLVNKGVFSTSVALDVINSHKPKEVVQYINDKTVIASGVPIISSGELEAVVVFVKDSKVLQEMTCHLQDLLIENNSMAKNLSKYNSKYLKDGVIVSNSKGMQRIMKVANRVSKLDTPVFLFGEQGCGKTMFAKYIHDMSLRFDQPFIKVDCSAIPDSILESELFDDSKGYNGSLMSQANGGTLFIDEIADMPLQCQQRLVYELNKIKDSTGQEEKRLDIRIIAASNENIDRNISEGKFRMDLYYLLNIIPIRIPPLRDRYEDIIPLMELFLNKYNEFYNENKVISPKCKKILINYSWPDNVRELENVVERLVVTTEDDIIDVAHVSELITNYSTTMEVGKDFKEKVENYEKKLILKYSKQVSSIKELALLLDINESTLRKKITRYNLDVTF